MRILVVDDSAFMRRSLTRLIQSDPDLTVIGTARDGRHAIQQIKELKPDLITLDVNQPRMNGLDALRQIMSECPTPAIMVSSLTKAGSREALEALRLGAVDFVAKRSSFVSLEIHSIRDELIAKIKSIGRSGARARMDDSWSAADEAPAPNFGSNRFDVVVIGASTGGPPAIEAIVSSLPGDFAVPVVIAQHMPPVFTRSFSQRLNGKCAVKVVEAEDGTPLRAGVVYVAPGARQTQIRRGRTCLLALHVNDRTFDSLYAPSVDALFLSAAQVVGARALGIMLTGMGDDGARGAAALAGEGGVVLTQSERSCVVYGMPRAVDELGASSASLTPRQMCEALRGLTGDVVSSTAAPAFRMAG